MNNNGIFTTTHWQLAKGSKNHESQRHQGRHEFEEGQTKYVLGVLVPWWFYLGVI